MSERSGTALREPYPRITFKDVVLDQVGDRCSVRVTLSLPPDVEMIGTAEGEASQQGRLWCAAEATARAIEKCCNRANLELAIIAVQLVETVHAVLIVVSLANPAKEEGKRLVGSCVVKEQLERSAVLAVLSATNRLVGMRLQ